jgi:colanic acid biosynthesis glycosyl transferase WcaI
MSDQRLRVCYFNRSYWPDTTATGQLLTELAEDLVNRHGLAVTVIAGYPIAGDAPAVGPDEFRNGVRIVRARGTTLSPRRFAGRAINYLTYFVSAVWRALRLPRQGMVFYCQDIFPEVAGLLEDFKSPAVNALLDRTNRLLVSRARRIVAIGETMASRLIQGKGASPAKVTVIANWADTSAIVPETKPNRFSTAHGLDAAFVVLHAGNIGLGQNLDFVLEAAALLRDRPDIVFLFIGDGNRRAALEDAARSRRLDNVRFLPFQPRDLLRWTYASSDVCLVSLKPGLAGYIVPSKLYPILAAGRPYIAAVESESEVAALTSTHRCGVVVPPGGASHLADVVVQLAARREERQSMGRRAREAAALFARDRQVAAHARLLEELGRA